MKIVKLNGAAMADVENLYIIVALSQQANAKNKTIVLVSAKNQIKDLLLKAANQAYLQDESYREKLQLVEQEYLQVVKELIPIVEQSAVLSRVKKMCNELESLCEGVSMVLELSSKVEDRILSYAELLPSYILSAKLQSLQIAHEWSDARELIRPNSNLGLAGISFSETGNAIRSMVNDVAQHLFILPDISIAYHKFSSIVSQSVGVEPMEIALGQQEERCFMNALSLQS